MMQFVSSICKDENDTKIIDLILTHWIVSLFIYDESWLDIDDLDLMREIIIVVHVHALYQTLLSCIQLIFIFLIFKYVEKLLKSRSNEDSDRICRKMNNEKRLIIQDLCDNLSYHHKKLRIQLYINWRTENDEQRWNDNIMLSNFILKLLHYAKDLNWIFNHTLSKLFNSMLIVD